MKIKVYLSGTFLLVAVLLLTTCDKDDDGKLFDDLNINLYSVNKDMELGEYMDSIISSDPVEYPVLDPIVNAEVYAYMEEMFYDIIASDAIKYGDKFDWELTIIDKDVLNAFAVPGGKLYFYTGLMKYLDNAAGFAGVLGHEIAHSDRRHATQQMTQVAGLSVVISALSGDSESKMKEIAQQMVVGIASLSFSRNDEYESDEYSVRYLSDTRFHPKGIANFFEKLEADEHSAASIEFLSTHPNDDNRLTNVDDIWKSIGSPEGGYFEDEWAHIKSLLP